MLKTIAMFHGISIALEVGIYPLWVETDSKILWNPLIGNARYANERFRLSLMLFGISIIVGQSLAFFGQTVNVTLLLMILLSHLKTTLHMWILLFVLNPCVFKFLCLSIVLRKNVKNLIQMH